MIGDFIVTPGQILTILVGEQGIRNGGGGGSFVTDASDSPLIIAGAGGGSFAGSNDSDEKHGKITTAAGSTCAAGGDNGNGGSVGASYACGAGGGLLTDGQDGAQPGGDSFLNGGAGGNGGWGVGGFGGGGAGSGNSVAGGGGGYSGGSGGSNSYTTNSAGGGGSYNGGINQDNLSGVHTGNGLIVITEICELIDITIDPAETVCPGTMVTITGTSTTGGTITWDNGIDNGVPFAATYTQTYTSSSTSPDDCSSEVTIYVEDFEDPDIPTLDDITVECIVEEYTPTTTDNCGDIEGTTTTTFPITEQGTITITWTFEDGGGNSVQADQDVIIADITDPTINCEDYTVYMDEGATIYTVDGDEFNPTADDNCDGETIENDYNSTATLDGEEFAAGTHTITWTVTDVGGNSAECVSVITVNDYVNIETFSQNGISIYPNPTSGILNFDFADNNVQNIVITDITGKTIVEKTELKQNETIDLSNFDNGIYLIKIQTATEIFTTKIIKE